MMFDIMERRDAYFKENSLQSPEQLPDIDAHEITITWDTVERQAPGDSETYTFYKCGGVVLFKELAFFENGARYREVAVIFRQKYGDRLRDIVPTWGGWLYLGGDSFLSRWKPEKAREEFFGKIAFS